MYANFMKDIKLYKADEDDVLHSALVYRTIVQNIHGERLEKAIKEAQKLIESAVGQGQMFVIMDVTKYDEHLLILLQGKLCEKDFTYEELSNDWDRNKYLKIFW